MKTKIFLGTIALALIGAGWCAVSQLQTPPVSGTSGWSSYENARYSIAFKYPDGWRVIDSSQAGAGMIGDNTFVLIPATLSNSHCDITRQTESLIANYRKYNPSATNVASTTLLSKIENCSIRIRVESNPKQLSLKNYLREVYLPIAQGSGMSEQMAAAINGLDVTGQGTVEEAQADFAFERARLSYADNWKQETVLYQEDFTKQSIIDSGNKVIFITNYIQKDRAPENLFSQFVPAVRVQ